ncbi:MAG: hypothetical protein Kow0098_22130 [Ignavibacteriaceae bacterium]
MAGLSFNGKGCIKGFTIGCGSLFFFIIILLIGAGYLLNLRFDKFTSDTTEERFTIKTDSTTGMKIIAADFKWQFVDEFLKNRSVILSLEVLEKEVREVMNYIDRVSKMSLSELGINQSEMGDDEVLNSKIVWDNIYRLVYNNNKRKFLNIIKGFNRIFEQQNMPPKTRLLFLITFVQNIEYKRPGGDLDLLPPLACIANRYGDCDTKALLLYILLESYNIDCVLFWSYKYAHAMLGVAVNGRGYYIKFKGKRYYFLETTYPDWDIGQISPEADNLRYWFVDDLDSGSDEIMKKEDDSFEEPVRRRDNKPQPAVQ